MRLLADLAGSWFRFIRACIVALKIGFGVLIALAGSFVVCFMAFQTSPWAVLIAIAPISWGYHFAMRALPNSFTSAPGTARIGKIKDLREAGLLHGTAQDIYCGLLKTQGILLLKKQRAFYHGDRHVITVGPSRSGKDTALLVPNLRHLHRSVIVIDPKAELAAITANYRRKLGPVLIINPFGVLTKNRPDLKSCGFNPLVDLDAEDSRFFAKSMGLAEAMIKIDSKDPHWARSARALACALIMRTKLREKKTGTPATIGKVNKLLTLPYRGGKDCLEEVMREIATYPFPDMAQLARKFVGEEGDKSEEIRGIISTAHGQTAFLNDGTLVADLERHPTVGGKPFDFEMLKHEIITVYIVLPDDMLTTHAVWLRLVVASAINALKRSGPGSVHPVLMLNEVGNLGHLEPLESGMGMAAGKGLTIWTVWQSLAQIAQIYGQHGFEAFMSGAGVINSFGAGDLETAKYLSDRVGHKTEIVSSYNQTPESKTFGKGESPIGLPLRRPEDILALKGRKLLSWIEPSSVPFELDAPGYFDLDGMTGLDPNPYRRQTESSVGWLRYGRA